MVLITSGRHVEQSEDQLTEVLIGCSNKAIHSVGSYLFCLVTFDAGIYHPLSKFEGGGGHLNSKFNKINIDNVTFVEEGLYHYETSTGALQIDFESKEDGLERINSFMDDKKKVGFVEFTSNLQEGLYSGPFMIKEINHKSAYLIRS